MENKEFDKKNLNNNTKKVDSTLNKQIEGQPINQNCNKHYTELNMQPLELILANDMPFVEGNIIKYVCRHRNKNGKEDLLKARNYIDIAIKKYYSDKDETDNKL